MLGEGGRGYLGYALRMKVCVYILSSVKGIHNFVTNSDQEGCTLGI